MTFKPLLLATLIASAAQAGTLSLTWTAPTQQTDDTPLTDLAGYNAYCGLKPDLSDIYHLQVQPGPTLTSFTWTDAKVGVNYCILKAFNFGGLESDASNIVTRTVVAPPKPRPKPPLISTNNPSKPRRALPA